MHYVYDFDHTLFETMSLWTRWLSVLKQEGVENSDATLAGESLFPHDFSLEAHLEKLGLKKTVLKKFNAVHDKLCPQLVFEDVVPFLEMCREEGVRQSILTRGNSEYQHRKIHESGLVDHVDDIFIASSEKGKADFLRELIENGSEPITYIDDSPRELTAVHKAGLPLNLVRMIREGARHAETEHPEDDNLWRVISGLEEMREGE